VLYREKLIEIKEDGIYLIKEKKRKTNPKG
jgi:hypothetical protein